MKTNKNDQKKMTAIQFMRTFEETRHVMESIENNTANEQKAILESVIDNEDYTNDDGVFSMNNLLDVDSGDGEDMQPRVYNSPVDELTDSDKAIIVDEFTKMLKDMHEDVIDFSDIGPVATVIQNNFGFKQDVEGFLRDTINKASDWQQNQTTAHGNETAGEEITDVENAPVNETDGPTDIEPTQSGIDEAPLAEPVMDEAPLDEPVMDEAPLDEPVVDEAPLDEPVMDEAPLDEPVVDEPVVDEITEELTETPEEKKAEDVAKDVAEDVADDTKAEGIINNVAEDTEAEDVAEDVAEDTEVEDDKNKLDIDAKLEAVKTEYLHNSKIETLIEAATKSLKAETSIDAQLESIKEDIVSEPNTTNESDEDIKPVTDEELDLMIAEIEGNKAEADENSDSDDDTDYVEVGKQKPAMAGIDEEGEFVLPESTEKISKKVESQLESISKAYHASENAIVEAAKSEKKLDAQLESIKNGYFKSVEKQEKEAKLDETLKGLVESYQDSKKTNLKKRQEIKKKLDAMS